MSLPGEAVRTAPRIQRTGGDRRLGGRPVRFRHFIGACTLALLSTSTSCKLGDATEDTGSINLYIEVDKPTLAIGETMTITVLARNVGFDPLSLTGQSDCLLYVEVLNNQGQVVWHSNGGCSGSVVTEEIAPGADKVQSFTWGGSNLAGARLGAGFYHVRPIARLTGGAHLGPTASIALE